jgi:glycosyltransferase involved in cell wall biosynthesis
MPGMATASRTCACRIDSRYAHPAGCATDATHWRYVGILPSIWDEAYGYAGLEFLAKGISVIANAIGGMVDYNREGETGRLNRSCSAAELAGIRGDLIAHPDQVAELNAGFRRPGRGSSSRWLVTLRRWTPCIAR